MKQGSDANTWKQIAQSSPTAMLLAKHLASRERVRNTSDIARTHRELLRDGAHVVESEYSQFWKDLADAGAGEIVVNKKGKILTFNWHTNMKIIAKAMLDGSSAENYQARSATKSVEQTNWVSKQKAKIAKAETVQSVVEQKRPASVGNGRAVCFPLRPDFMLEINVPMDFSVKDADTISSMLKRLAR